MLYMILITVCSVIYIGYIQTLWGQNVKKVKAFPLQALDRPLGFQEVVAPEFLVNRHMILILSLMVLTEYHGFFDKRNGRH
jgi:hypothetical protein